MNLNENSLLNKTEILKKGKVMNLHQKHIYKLILIENIIITFFAIGTTILLSIPFTKYLYQNSIANYFQIEYHMELNQIIGISILLFGLSLGVAKYLRKELEKNSIIENIRSVE